MADVEALVSGLTDDGLDARVQPPDEPGWPPPQPVSVRECLLVVLNEEWQHRRYAERDLSVLEQRESSAGV